jgi:hypothetical protein
MTYQEYRALGKQKSDAFQKYVLGEITVQEYEAELDRLAPLIAAYGWAKK